MRQNFKKTMQKQVQDSLNNPGTLFKKPAPKEGWIQLYRNALGMTTYQLAKRLGYSQANLMAMQQREKKGTITLEALEKVAEAMNCRCVYVFVPNKPLDQLLQDQARLVAKKRLRSVEHTMELEAQGLTQQQKKQQEEELVQELLHDDPKHLWNDDES